jgi:hypothetical protein
MAVTRAACGRAGCATFWAFIQGRTVEEIRVRRPAAKDGAGKKATATVPKPEPDDPRTMAGLDDEIPW